MMESLPDSSLLELNNNTENMPEEELVFDYDRSDDNAGDFSYTETEASESYYDESYYQQQDQGNQEILPQHEQNAIQEAGEEEEIRIQQEEQEYYSEEKGGEAYQQQQEDDDDDDDDDPLLSPSTVTSSSSRRVDVHKGHYNDFRLSLAVDAAQLGKLTRLNEHVVTAVATEKPKKELQDWTGIKGASNLNTKSAFIRVCIEAAAMGRLHRGNEKSYTVTNYDESEDHRKDELDEDANEKAKGMIDEILETMEETQYQLDEILNELEVLQEVDPGSIAEFIPVLDQLKSQVDALTAHLMYQPNSTTRRLDKVIQEQRADISKSWSHHLTVIEDLEHFQNTKDTFDDQNLAVLPSFEEPKFEKPTMFITKGKQRKVIPVQAAKEGMLKMELLSSGNEIRIRSTCNCLYCKNPSSFQTQSYKHMRDRKKSNDNTLKTELVDLARKGKTAKKMVLKSNDDIKNPLKPTPKFPGMKHGLSWKSPRTQRRQFREAEARRKILEQQKAHMEQNLPAIGEELDKAEEPASPAKRREQLEGGPMLWISSRMLGASSRMLGTSARDLDAKASPVSDGEEKPSSFGAGLMSFLSPRSKKKRMQKAEKKEGDKQEELETKKTEQSAASRLMSMLSPSTKKKNKIDSRSNTNDSNKSSFVIPALPGLDDDESVESRANDQLDEKNIADNSEPNLMNSMPALPSLDDDDDQQDSQPTLMNSIPALPSLDDDDQQDETIPDDNTERNLMNSIPALPSLDDDEESTSSTAGSAEHIANDVANPKLRFLDDDEVSMSSAELEDIQEENELNESAQMSSSIPNARNLTGMNASSRSFVDELLEEHDEESEYSNSEHNFSSRSLEQDAAAQSIGAKGTATIEECDYMMPLKGGDSSHNIEFDHADSSEVWDLENSGKSGSSVSRNNSYRSDDDSAASKSSRSSRRRNSRSDSISSNDSSRSRSSRSKSKSERKSSKISRCESELSTASCDPIEVPTQLKRVKSDGSVRSSRSSKSNRRTSSKSSRRSRSGNLSADTSVESVPPTSEGAVRSSRSSKSKRRSESKSERKSRSKSVKSDASLFSEDMASPLPSMNSLRSGGSAKSTKSSRSSRSERKLSRHLSLQPHGADKPERRAPKRSNSVKSAKSTKSDRSISPLPSSNSLKSGGSVKSSKSSSKSRSTRSERKLSRHLSLQPEGVTKPERRTPKRSNSIGSTKSSKSTKSRSKLTRHLSMPKEGSSKPERRTTKEALRKSSLDADDLDRSSKSERKSSKVEAYPQNQSEIRSDGSAKSSRSRKKLSRHLSMPKEGSRKPERRASKRSGRDRHEDAHKRERTLSPPRSRSFLAPSPRIDGIKEFKDSEEKAPEIEYVRTDSGRMIPGLEEYRALVKMAVAENASDVSSLFSSQGSLSSNEGEDEALPSPIRPSEPIVSEGHTYYEI